MTTAAESCLQSECDDLKRRLDALATRCANKDGQIRRLNELLVLREAEIDRLTLALERAQAQLAEAIP